MFQKSAVSKVHPRFGVTVGPRASSFGMSTLKAVFTIQYQSSQASTPPHYHNNGLFQWRYKCLLRPQNCSHETSPARGRSEQRTVIDIRKVSILSFSCIGSSLVSNRHYSQKMNSHCFDKCIPSPGSSLSSREQKCLTTCMEKYIAAWNTVSRQYIARIQKTADGGDMGGFGM